MPWVRIDDRAMSHPKILRLSDGAFRLWVSGLAFCQQHLTDGAIERAVLRTLQGMTRSRVKELLDAGLWDQTADGFSVHDYLQWNESREKVLEDRRHARERMKLIRTGRTRSPERSPERSPNVRHVHVANVHDTTRHHTTPQVPSTNQKAHNGARAYAFLGKTFRVSHKQLQVVYDHLGDRAHELGGTEWLLALDEKGKPEGDLLDWLKREAANVLKARAMGRSVNHVYNVVAREVREHGCPHDTLCDNMLSCIAKIVNARTEGATA